MVNIYIIVEGDAIQVYQEQNLLTLQQIKQKQQQKGMQRTSFKKKAHIIHQHQCVALNDYEFDSSVKLDFEFVDKTKSCTKYEDVLNIMIREQKIIRHQNGECFGNFHAIAGSSWDRSVIYAESDCILMELDCNKLQELMERLNDNQNYKQMLAFLNTTITGFDVISRLKRDRIARAFKEKIFPVGTCLVKENTIQQNAYIIQDGTCLIVSNKNPIMSEVSIYGDVSSIKRAAMTKKGYMSKTVNQFRIGTISSGDWVAQDIALVNSQILKQDENPQIFNYSVLAQTQVKAFEISLNDLKSKLPKEFILNLEQTYQERKNWKTVRLMDIQKANRRIYMNNSNIDAYEEAIQNVGKVHSQATSSAQNNFRNKFLAVSQPDPNGDSIFNKYTLRNRLKSQQKNFIKTNRYQEDEESEQLSNRNRHEIKSNMNNTELKQVRFHIDEKQLRSKSPAIFNKYLLNDQSSEQNIYNMPNKGIMKNQLAFPLTREVKSALNSPRIYHKVNSHLNSNNQSLNQTPEKLVSDYQDQNMIKVSELIDQSNIDANTSSAVFQNKYLQPSTFLNRRKYSQDDGNNSKRPWTQLNTQSRLSSISNFSKYQLEHRQGFKEAITKEQETQSIAELSKPHINTLYRQEDHTKVFMENAFTIKNKGRLAKRYYLPTYKLKEQFKIDSSNTTSMNTQGANRKSQEIIETTFNQIMDFRSSANNIYNSKYTTYQDNEKSINSSRVNISFMLSGRRISIQKGLKSNKSNNNKVKSVGTGQTIQQQS
ncbi:UNKNOWN [Stylonychia lemnae]|uniref:Cyclic nucleotide-binding domain-containing protein n=1 Tax=Stylonychia lemnae TaxID=5949 RepID=A0A078A4N9_STYLE|nr:UNKNOWN [Stylonychia lemnae]|eukprot:CDW76844.1 UNKNOWN [Stylonychia lemnae]